MENVIQLFETDKKEAHRTSSRSRDGVGNNCVMDTIVKYDDCNEGATSCGKFVTSFTDIQSDQNNDKIILEAKPSFITPEIKIHLPLLKNAEYIRLSDFKTSKISFNGFCLL